MKTNKIFAVVAMSVSLIGCKYNIIDEPPIKDNNHIIDENAKVISIKQLKNIYAGRATEVIDNVVVEAIVSSDDTDGNFYKTLTIQDETGGIEVKLGMYNLSTLYPQGSKVRLKCQGLTLGTYGGQINIGYRSNNEKYETAFYPESHVPAIIQKIENARPIDPVVISSYSEINESMQGKLVRLDGVQFSNADLNSTIGDTSKNKAIKSTKLVFSDNNQVEVRTSGYARFVAFKIPNESGSVTGVLTFFKGSPQLTICRAKDIQLNKTRF